MTRLAFFNVFASKCSINSTSDCNHFVGNLLISKDFYSYISLNGFWTRVMLRRKSRFVSFSLCFPMILQFPYFKWIRWSYFATSFQNKKSTSTNNILLKFQDMLDAYVSAWTDINKLKMIRQAMTMPLQSHMLFKCHSITKCRYAVKPQFVNQNHSYKHCNSLYYLMFSFYVFFCVFRVRLLCVCVHVLRRSFCCVSCFNSTISICHTHKLLPFLMRISLGMGYRKQIYTKDIKTNKRA